MSRLAQDHADRGGCRDLGKLQCEPEDGMRTTYLHAGLHKTGTTLIQNTLYANLAALRAAGVNYLDIEANHSPVLYSLFSARAGSYHMNRRLGITPGESLERHNAALRAALETRLAASECDRFVLSGEDVSVLTEEELGRLKTFLQPYAGRIKVILYLRHPIPWIASEAQERLKSGHRLETLRKSPPPAEYRGRLEKFIRVFGRDWVDFRLYRRDTEPNWDVLDDFLGAIGCPELAGKLAPATDANQGMSAAAAEAIDALNRLCPCFLAEGAWNPERARGAAGTLVKLGGPSFRFSPRESQINEAALAADLDWVRRETGLALDPTLKRAEPPEAEPAFGEERAAEIAAIVNELCLRNERSNDH